MYQDDNSKSKSWTLDAGHTDFSRIPGTNGIVSSCIVDPADKNSNTACATVFPIVLSHGMGYSAGGLLGVGYWYNIPQALQGNGADVFISDQTAIDSTADRAVQLQKFVLQVLAESGASKVNIIGHSQGGLDARYMISNLGMSSQVASLTTVATPNLGSSVADVMLGLNKDTGGWMAGLADDVYTGLFGGRQNSIAGARSMSVDYMTNIFNPSTPDMPGVYYQSYSSTITFPCLLDKTVFMASAALLYFYEGENDGLVSTWSARWGDYRGNLNGSMLGSGISHVNTCGQFLGITPCFDAPGFYVKIANGLKCAGF